MVLLVHPHWSPRMLAEHLRKNAEHMVAGDPSDEECFGNIMWSQDS